MLWITNHGTYFKDQDTVLTGILDRSALYGVLAQIEALALDLVELRRLDPQQKVK
jgi:hypothetical protein